MPITRRGFIKLTGTGALSTVTISAVAQEDRSASAVPGALIYPETAITRLDELSENEPVSFQYPDNLSMCELIKCGRPVPGGIGPDQDIVAYSILCPHMGCPTQYDRESRRYRCGCHFSLFDPEMDGQQIMGQATQDLPRVLLKLDASNGEISAVGINRLLFGRQQNILPQNA